MTIRRAEFLTGYEIRRIRSKRTETAFGAFEGGDLITEARHFDERTALRTLVKRVYVLHCRAVLEEHRFRCARCRCSRPLQFHHKKPRSLGGTHRKENIEPLCWTCHRLTHLRRKR